VGPHIDECLKDAAAQSRKALIKTKGRGLVGFLRELLSTWDWAKRGRPAIGPLSRLEIKHEGFALLGYMR
jgi:hypothetical protein